jgi:O-antigen/teichoic acid export membrane protein
MPDDQRVTHWNQRRSDIERSAPTARLHDWAIRLLSASPDEPRGSLVRSEDALSPPERQATPGADDLFGRATATAEVVSRGVLWKLGSQFTIQLFGLVISLGIARILSTSEYGTASLALAFAAFATIFSDLTLGAVLVQRRVVSQAETSSLMWFSAVLGLCLTIAFALLAPALASLLGRHSLQPILIGVAPVFLLSTLGTVPTALLNRRMAYRALELRSMAAIATSATVALVVAMLGGGAWALVGQQIAQVTVLTSLAWIAAAWLPSLTFSRSQLGRVVPFGLYALGSRALGTLAANLDNVLVGAFLGTAALGPYAIAYNILLIPLARLAMPVQEVAYPTFSSLDDRLAVGRLWLRANAALLVIMTPVMLALAVEAPDFVRVVLGGRWSDAGPVLRLLAVGGFFQCLTWLTAAVLQACHRERLLLGYAAGRTAALITAFAVGLHWGIDGVAAGFAIASALVAPFGVAAVTRSTGVPFAALAASLGRLLAAAAVLSGVMVAVRAPGLLTGLPALFVVPAVGFLAFAGLLLGAARNVVVDLRLLATSAGLTARLPRRATRR